MGDGSWEQGAWSLEIGGQRSVARSQNSSQIFDRDLRLAEDALQCFRRKGSMVWNSYSKA